jgi:flagellin-like protein
MQRRRGPRAERAVSEVLSVLLMVTVTIVLAAMVGSVLMDIVSGVEDNSLAGVQIEFDDTADEITVVYTVTQKKGTTVDVKVLDEDGEICEKRIDEVGDERTFTNGNCGSGSDIVDGNDYTIRVVANGPKGKQSVVREADGSM